MPGTGRKWLSVLIALALGLAGGYCAGGAKGNTNAGAQGGGSGGVGTGGGTSTIDQQARDDIKKINDYLGTAEENHENEKSLLPTINKNNDYLRTVIKKMQCDIFDLQNHTHNCPGIGGGSTSPTNVPKYPA